MSDTEEYLLDDHGDYILDGRGARIPKHPRQGSVEAKLDRISTQLESLHATIKAINGAS